MEAHDDLQIGRGRTLPHEDEQHEKSDGARSGASPARVPNAHAATLTNQANLPGVSQGDSEAGPE